MTEGFSLHRGISFRVQGQNSCQRNCSRPVFFSLKSGFFFVFDESLCLSYTSLKPRQALNPSTQPHEEGGSLMLVPIDSILPDPDNLGRPIDDRSLEDLRKNGGPLGVQPVVVRLVSGQVGSYMIVIGERRWRLAQAACQVEIDVTLQENLGE